MPKPFLTYKQQIQKLKDKHLVIHNEVNAAEELRLNGYFALILAIKACSKIPPLRIIETGQPLMILSHSMNLMLGYGN